MPKFNDTWVVQPHGPLECLDDGLWTVEGEIVMPLGRFPRRMTIAALSEGRLAIWSPVPVDAATLRQIEDLGCITFLIVPGVGHRLDIRGLGGALQAGEDPLPARRARGGQRSRDSSRNDGHSR